MNELAVLTGSVPERFRPTSWPIFLQRHCSPKRGYYTAVADVVVARANLYSRLSLSGAITLSAIGKSDRVEYFFGPVVQFPSLN